MHVHPLTGLAAAGSTAVITTAAGSLPLSVAVVAGSLAVSAAGGTARRLLPAAAAVLVPLTASLVMVHGLAYPEGGTVLAQWGPARVTAEGLGVALQRGAQVWAAVLALLAFSFSVSVPDLVAALNAKGVRGRFGFVLASTLTLLPAIASQAGRIRKAQESRGLVIRRGMVHRLAAFRLQAIPLVLALMDDAGTRGSALEARGFSSTGPRTSYRTVPDSTVQRVLRAALVLAAVAAVVLRLLATGEGG